MSNNDHDNPSPGAVHFAAVMEYLYATAEQAIAKTALMRVEFEQDYQRGVEMMDRDGFRNMVSDVLDHAKAEGKIDDPGPNEVMEVAAALTQRIVQEEEEAQKRVAGRSPLAALMGALEGQDGPDRGSLN